MAKPVKSPAPILVDATPPIVRLTTMNWVGLLILGLIVCAVMAGGVFLVIDSMYRVQVEVVNVRASMENNKTLFENNRSEIDELWRQIMSMKGATPGSRP